MAGTVSILVAVYNTEKYLRECLDSLINQTYTDLQIICIDDASTDGSLAILKEYELKDSRILVLQNKENLGQSKTRNHGLEYATGEYCGMVDSDDWIEPDAIEKIVNTFEQSPLIDTVLFDLILWYDKNNMPRYEIHTDKTSFTGEEAMKISLNWNIHGLYITRTHIHKKYPYDTSTRYTADDITTKMHFFESREVRLSDAKYFYRQHAQSISNSITIRRFDMVIADFSLKKHLTSLNASTEILSIHEQLRWYNIINSWDLYFTNKNSFTETEQNEIEATLSHYSATIDNKLIPLKLKLRTLFIPFSGVKGVRFWAKYYCGLRRHTPKFLLKKRLDL